MDGWKRRGKGRERRRTIRHASCDMIVGTFTFMHARGAMHHDIRDDVSMETVAAMLVQKASARTRASDPSSIRIIRPSPTRSPATSIS
jgi:hypothetical protein